MTTNQTNCQLSLLEVHSFWDIASCFRGHPSNIQVDNIQAAMEEVACQLNLAEEIFKTYPTTARHKLIKRLNSLIEEMVQGRKQRRLRS